MHLRLVFGALLLLGLAACASGYGDTPDNPIHITRPTREEIMAHYPPAALAQGVSGSALVACEVVSGGVLDHCRVVQETPAGRGFGEAAVQVAFEHHVQPDASGRMPVGRRIELPVTFAPPR